MSAGDVQIWFRATDTLDDAAIAAAAAVLSPEELEQYQRFHFARDARDYAVAHALLRHTLSRREGRPPADWLFDKTPSGKPFLRNAGDSAPSFSLSHTRGMVACAVTAGADVGVDVECVDRDVNTAEIAARFFAPAEAAHLMRLGAEARRDRFFDLWTLKEALVKALGVGMATSLASLAFTVGDDGRVRLEAPPEIAPMSWQFGLFAPASRYRLAVAVRRPPPETGRLVLRSHADAG
jgi:4'-phosphopantetheinyl transferase